MPVQSCSPGLKESKDPRSVPALMAVAEDEDRGIEWFVRHNAILALRDISNPRVVACLSGLLEDQNVDIRSTAATALGYLKDQEAVKPPVQVLMDDDNSER